VRRVELGEDGDLLLNILNFILGAFEIDDLYRDRALCAFVVALVNLSKRPFA
jgi:hypothetical protein